MKVDLFDTNVRVECVLVGENRKARKVGHVKSFLKNIVFDTIRCLWQRSNVPLPRNLFLKSVFLSTPGTKVPVVDAEPLFHRYLTRKVFVDAIGLRRGGLNFSKASRKSATTL